MKQAVILAAGEGQRLRPFTVNKPKVMLSIGTKPILEYVIDSLVQNGIRNLVLVVGYCRSDVVDCLGSGKRFGADITYVTQKSQLGTAHALAQAKGLTDAEFLVVSGDNLITADTIAPFVTVKPEAVLVKTVDNPSRYGVVNIEAGIVKDIVEKPKMATNNVINAGIYAFTTEIFSFIEGELDIPDTINKMIAQGYTINAVETHDTWLDMVYPWDILTLNDAVICLFPRGLAGNIEPGVSLKHPVSVGKDSVIRSNSYIAGPVVIGRGCDIGPNVCILPATSIGDNVAISSFTEIKNSVLGNDISIGAGSIIENSVISNGCVIKGHFSACSDYVEVKIKDEHHFLDVGTILGEGCRLGNGVVTQPGVIMGNHSQIQAFQLISGRLPDGSLVS